MLRSSFGSVTQDGFTLYLRRLWGGGYEAYNDDEPGGRCVTVLFSDEDLPHLKDSAHVVAEALRLIADEIEGER